MPTSKSESPISRSSRIVLDEAAPSPLGVWVLAARPKTLWAAVAPVIVGTALAVEAGGFHAPSAFLALVGALLIQIGTNFHNDLSDYLKGADTEHRKGPLRVTQAGLVAPGAMRSATFLAFGLAVAAGGYLIWRGGPPILLIGILSIIAGLLYTGGRYSLAYLGLGDLFVLIFFGPVAVGGTYYVQVLGIAPVVLYAGLVPGLVAVAILLVNNIRDVDEDRMAGKRTLVVRLGRPFAVAFYVFCVSSTVWIPVALYSYTGAHPWSLLGGLALLPALPVVRKLARPVDDARVLNPLLGQTARVLLFFSLLFSIGWNL